MKKLLSLVCIFTAIAYQLAQAQGNAYESAGYGAPEYVEVNGVRYARIPQHSSKPSSHYRLDRSNPRLASQKTDYQQSESGYMDKLAVWKTRPYIGLDVMVDKMKFSGENGDDEIIPDKSFRNRFNSYSGVVGAHLNRYLGVEAFYQQSSEGKKSDGVMSSFSEATIKTSFSFVAYGLDALLYIPTTQKLDLLFGVGYAYYDFDISAKLNLVHHTGASITKKYKTPHDVGAVRLGLGLQYQIWNDLYLRMMARYINFGDSEYIKNMKEFSLGLRYLF